MESKKIYKVSVKENCTKCGICSMTMPNLFLENDSGVITVKKDFIFENDVKDVKSVIELCASNAITIDECSADTLQNELSVQIRKIISDKLENIEFQEPSYGECSLDSNEMKANGSYKEIISPYKYRDLEPAEAAGVKELNKILEKNRESVIQGALMDCKYKVINKFIDRDDHNYYFRDLELQIEHAVTMINDLIKKGWRIDVPYSVDKVELDKLKYYSTLDSMENSIIWCTPVEDLDMYVSVDFNSDDKWRYEISSENIDEMFSSLIYNYMSGSFEDALVDYIRFFYNDYGTNIMNNINEYKKEIFKLIPLDKKSNTKTNFKTELNKITTDFMNTKQEIISGSYIYLDTNYDSSFCFSSYSSADKASENRAERLEKDFEQGLRQYGDTLAEAYAKEMQDRIKKYLSDIHNLCLKCGIELQDRTVQFKLDSRCTVLLDVNDVLVSNVVFDVLVRYVENICKDVFYQLNYSICVFTSIDDSEIYIGESIFGRSKFTTKYNYSIKDELEIKDKFRNEMGHFDSILLSKNITKDVYKLVGDVISEEINKLV